MSLDDALKRSQKRQTEMIAADVARQRRDSWAKEQLLKMEQELDHTIRPCFDAILQVRGKYLDQLRAKTQKQLLKDLRREKVAHKWVIVDSSSFPGTTCGSHVQIATHRSETLELYTVSPPASCNVSISLLPATRGSWVCRSVLNKHRAGGQDSDSYEFASGGRTTAYSLNESAFANLLQGVPECFAAYLSFYGIPFPSL